MTLKSFANSVSAVNNVFLNGQKFLPTTCHKSMFSAHTNIKMCQLLPIYSHLLVLYLQASPTQGTYKSCSHLLYKGGGMFEILKTKICQSLNFTPAQPIYKFGLSAKQQFLELTRNFLRLAKITSTMSKNYIFQEKFRNITVTDC